MKRFPDGGLNPPNLSASFEQKSIATLTKCFRISYFSIFEKSSFFVPDNLSRTSSDNYNWKCFYWRFIIIHSKFFFVEILIVQVRLGQVRLGQVRLGQVRLGQVRLGQVRIGWDSLGQVRIGQVRLGQDMLGQVR